MPFQIWSIPFCPFRFIYPRGLTRSISTKSLDLEVRLSSSMKVISSGSIIMLSCSFTSVTAQMQYDFTNIIADLLFWRLSWWQRCWIFRSLYKPEADFPLWRSLFRDRELCWTALRGKEKNYFQWRPRRTWRGSATLRRASLPLPRWVEKITKLKKFSK